MTNRAFEPMTAQCVRDLWDYTIAETNGVWVDKRSDKYQQLIGEFLELANIQPKSLYITKYMTTLPIPGMKTIFATPFTPGDPTPDFDLEAQADGAPHEGDHAWYAKKLGAYSFDRDYIFSTPHRSHTESRANRSMGEVARARKGLVLDAEWLASQMQFYGCAQEIPFSRAENTSMLIAVNAGGIVEGEFGQKVIDWYRARYPEMIMLDPYDA